MDLSGKHSSEGEILFHLASDRWIFRKINEHFDDTLEKDWSNEKKLGWLGYVGDYTTQLLY